MRKHNSNSVLADIGLALLLSVPSGILLIMAVCHLERIFRALCMRQRGGTPEMLELRTAGRIVMLNGPHSPTIPLPGDFTSLDIFDLDLEAGHLSLGAGDNSSEGSNDNPSPIQGDLRPPYLRPPSYDSIFGHHRPNTPCYTDAVTNVTFPSPESAVLTVA